MPNDCWNNITIKATNEQIRTILTSEFTNVPAWAFTLFQVGQEVLYFKLWSRWSPDRDFMDKLLNTYAGIWIKNVWDEEGGVAGVIVGTKGYLRSFDWEEGCIEEWAHRQREDPTLPQPVLRANENV